MRILALLGSLALSLAAQAANNAAFVSQTVPTVMVPGQNYTVSVTLQNSGTTTWTPGTYRAGAQNPLFNTTWGSDGRMYLPSGASIAPGQNGTFSKTVTAPSTPGTYGFQWRVFQELVEWFGEITPNVNVKVGLNDAAFVAQSIAPVMTPGQSYAVTVTMNNTGGRTWTPGTYHRLGSQNPPDNFTWGTNRVLLAPGSSIAPGSNGTFSFNVTAPTTPGTYNFQWKMLEELVEWFGAQSANATIKVGLDNAAFVSQSVPTAMGPGQNYPVSITMQNTEHHLGGGERGHRHAKPRRQHHLEPEPRPAHGPGRPGREPHLQLQRHGAEHPRHLQLQWRMVQGTNGWFGAQSTNIPVAVDIFSGAPPANVYFIHTDHLNTPRLVSNVQQQPVWRWDQQEPFGINAPDENPSALGTFEFPLRFPGQYFDQETNLHYNYFRDYDTVLGRYVESDPIGLRGSLNTFLYANGNPLSYIDPKGEAGLGGALVLGGIAAIGVGIAISMSSSSNKGVVSSSKSDAQCPPNERDDYCEKVRQREESLCVAIAGPRYPGNPQQAIAICMKAAFQRYIRCRQGLPEHEWPPLTGVDTPI